MTINMNWALAVVTVMSLSASAAMWLENRSLSSMPCLQAQRSLARLVEVCETVAQVNRRAVALVTTVTGLDSGGGCGDDYRQRRQRYDEVLCSAVGAE